MRPKLIWPSIRWWAWFMIWSAAYCILALLLFPLTNPLVNPSRRWFHRLNRVWGSVTMRVAFGPDFRVHGLENLPPQEGRWILVSNHQSLLDILVTLTLPRTFRFTVKHTMFFVPFLGFFMWGGGYLSVRRGDLRSAARVRQRSCDLIADGIWIHLFAEGTRSRDGGVDRFRKGAFEIARQAGAGIVPLTIQGTGAMLPRGRFFSDHMPHPFDFRVHPPIPADEVAATEPAELARRLRKQLAEVVAADAVAQEREMAQSPARP